MKQKIKLCTDSASDIPKEFEEKYDIGMFQFHITVDDFGFRERDIPNEEFYERIAHSKVKPTTAQITVFEFTERFRQYHGEGYTDVIYISISSRGSQTNAAAHMARNEIYEENPELKENFRIYIIDSGSYTGVYGYSVCQAAKKLAKGATAEEVVAYAEDWAEYADVVFGCYTLEYAKRSARISSAAAFVGEVLGLRPIIRIRDGISDTIAKVRGDKSVIPKILEKAQEAMVPKAPYCVFCGSNADMGDEMEKEAEKKFGYPPEMRFQLGAAVVANAGPETTGIIFRAKTSIKDK